MMDILISISAILSAFIIWRFAWLLNRKIFPEADTEYRDWNLQDEIWRVYIVAGAVGIIGVILPWVLQEFKVFDSNGRSLLALAFFFGFPIFLTPLSNHLIVIYYIERKRYSRR